MIVMMIIVMIMMMVIMKLNNNNDDNNSSSKSIDNNNDDNDVMFLDFHGGQTEWHNQVQKSWGTIHVTTAAQTSVEREKSKVKGKR